MASLLEVYSYNQHFVAMMNVINMARLNPPIKGHKHHIIPRCWFKLKGIDIDNSKDNIVLLSEEDHIKVHKLAILCSKDAIMRSKQAFAVKRLLKGNFSGMKHTEETKAIIKEKRKYQIITEESKKKRSLALKGRKKPVRSEAHKQHLRESAKGRHWKLVDGRRVWWHE